MATGMLPVILPLLNTTSVQLSNVREAIRLRMATGLTLQSNLFEKATLAATTCKTVVKTPRMIAPSQVEEGVTPNLFGKYSKMVWAVEITSSFNRSAEMMIPATEKMNEIAAMPVILLFISFSLSFY